MEKSRNDEIWDVFGEIGNLLLVMIFIMLFRGYVLSILWMWFVVPLGVLPITAVHGIGIFLLVCFLSVKKTPKNSEEKQQKSSGEKAALEFLTATLYTLLMWGMGAILHIFM